MNRFKFLSESIQLGHLQLKHRMIMGPMWSRLSTVTGEVTQKMIDYYVARAKGGAALITIEATGVDRRYGWPEPTLLLDNRAFQPGLHRLVEAIHLNGAAAVIQLINPGTFAAKAISPSGVPFMGQVPGKFTESRPMTVEEIEELRDNFIAAAVLAKEIEFDGVTIHGAGAYLLHQFRSPLTNRRTDKYGGNLENRMRLPLEIIRGIRAKCGADFIVGYRFVEDELLPGGVTREESTIFAKALEQEGVDYIDLQIGSQQANATDDRSPGYTKYTRFGAWKTMEIFKRAVGVRIVARAYGDYDPVSWEKHLEAGHADFVQIAKPLLCDSDLINKVLEERLEDIRPCTNCLHCAEVGVIGHDIVECALNPETTRERDYIIRPVSDSKKVLVIGGGPGGLEAARVAALRGHKVTLMEKSEELGGNLRFISQCVDNEPYGDFLNWEVRQCRDAGVTIELNKEVTLETTHEFKPDAVILATGAPTPIFPDIPGISKPHVVRPEDVLMGNVSLGKKVVVIGGNRVGVEVAYTIAKKGLSETLTIIEPQPVPSVGYDMETANMAMMTICLLPKLNVKVLTGTRIEEVRDDGVLVVSLEGKKQKIAADTVILAMGYAPDKRLYEALKVKVKELYAIGDCVKSRTVRNAIHEGAYVARQI